MSNTPASNAAWINRFGTIAGLTARTTQNGAPFMVGKLVSVAKSGKPFETNFITFNAKVIAALKAVGNNGFISLRGVMEDVEKDGGKFAEPRFKGLMVNESRKDTAAKADAVAADAPEADAPVTETPAAPVAEAPKAKRSRAKKAVEDSIPA